MTIHLPSSTCKVAIIGLGYVGLPLALRISSSTSHSVIGYDIDRERIRLLKQSKDSTGEARQDELRSFFLKSIVTADKSDLVEASVFIVTVPTPIDNFTNPDLSPLIQATELISDILAKKSNDPNNVKSIVIYESTVYPGVTDDICIPILSRHPTVTYGLHFDVGYSPERVSPGQSTLKLADIRKIVSGNNPELSRWIADFYSSFINAGVFVAASIKAAEAAKVLENVQRDVNIALMNEISVLFKTMNIDTHDVIDAASSKWNFVEFRPGTVGGHCIGVDPYYLLHIARKHKCNLRLVSSAREVNEFMPGWIARSIVKEYTKKSLKVVNGARALMLGATFKENCPDLRNSKALLTCKLLAGYGFNVDLVDYLVGSTSHTDEYGYDYDILSAPSGQYDLIVFAVKHDRYLYEYEHLLHTYKSVDGCLVVDLKNMLPRAYTDLRL